MFQSKGQRALCSVVNFDKNNLHVFTFSFLRRWFLQTATVYDRFVMVQLVGSVMTLAIFIYYLDMVCFVKIILNNH